MTAPTITPSKHPQPEVYHALLLLHGHRCPMSILGARLGFAARAAVGQEDRGDRHLHARYLHRTCALDGIQMVTQCTPGNGNLEVVAEGRHELHLFSRQRQLTARAALRSDALEQGRQFNQLRQQQAEVAEDAPRYRALQQQLDAILRQLETAPSASLLDIRLEGHSG